MIGTSVYTMNEAMNSFWKSCITISVLVWYRMNSDIRPTISDTKISTTFGIAADISSKVRKAV